MSRLKHIYNYFYQENLMSEKGLTTINLKKINRSKVYQYIYQTHQTSKMQIVQDLQMGLSTVSQNLNLLEKEGLIDRNGYFDSTGGRKAQAIQIVSDFRISIGIVILKNMFHITAIDLYGNAFYTETIALPYSNTEEYYRQLTDKVRKFIAENHYPNEKILGISIATQGITSPDNSTVIYGNIMNNTGMKLEDFSRHLPYPCHLEHDSKSAAFLELWNHPELDSAVVFLLNRNLGGAIITNHQIHQGSSMHSGTLEHMCVNPDGPLCYCGNHGCLETYCSATGVVRTTLAMLEASTGATELRNIPEEEITSYAVYKAAMAGDTLAREVFRQTGTRIGKACAEIATFLSPEAFIFFGGLAQAGDLLFRPIEEAYNEHVLSLYKGKAKFLMSGLDGAKAAILGAAAMASEL